MAADNPFIHSRVLAPDQVVDRDDEVEHLVGLALQGQYARLVAPRRYGKTSLVGKLLAQAERDHGMPGVLVDLWGVDSLADLAIRIERAYAEQLRPPVRKRVEAFLATLELGLSLGTQGISAVFHRRPAQVDPLPALHALLELPRTAFADSGPRAIVVFDEFQAIGNLARGDELLRSHIQHHGDVASYVFAGSAPGMMRLLFGDRRRPLFGQADPVDLGPLPDGPAAAYIAERFAAARRDPGPALSALLRLARGHPQRLMLLAHRLFEATPRRGAADESTWQAALEGTLASLDAEFSTQWGGYSAGERRTLRAIADQGEPFSQDAEARHDLNRGMTGRSLRKLRDAGDVDLTSFQIVDPLLERWIRRRILRMQDLPPAAPGRGG